MPQRKKDKGGPKKKREEKGTIRYGASQLQCRTCQPSVSWLASSAPRCPRLINDHWQIFSYKTHPRHFLRFGLLMKWCHKEEVDSRAARHWPGPQ